jgi:pyruvate formate lyase activating enzyme
MENAISRRHFLRRCARYGLGCAAWAWAVAGTIPVLAGAAALAPSRGRLGRKLSPYFIPLENKAIRCTLCPRECEVDPGERGYCRVRENVDGSYYTLTYGNPCSVQVDPIEKKPFFHVLPTSRSFSLATAGCNFNCKFCQNWEISQAKPDDTFNYDLPPDQVIEQALAHQCQSIASTYVEPTIFAEYMLDIGRLAKERGLLKVIHSNGFINPGPLAELCTCLAAACIDLKGFTEAYYRDLTEGSLRPVLDTLLALVRHGVHTEIVNLVVPGKNDDPGEVRAMCRWIKSELGAGVPLHFTRFYPLYKLKSLPPTPVATLEKLHAVAREEGLAYVYIGNVTGHPAEHTSCPRCGLLLIERVGYRVRMVRMREGCCDGCGLPIPGIWTPPAGRRDAPQARISAAPRAAVSSRGPGRWRG